MPAVTSGREASCARRKLGRARTEKPVLDGSLAHIWPDEPADLLTKPVEVAQVRRARVDRAASAWLELTAMS
jgi:hypothetical protein